MYAMAHSAYPQNNQPVPSLVWRGIDLSTASWFASAELPPNSSYETLKSSATPTSPTVNLRSPVSGGVGTLFAVVNLPTPIPSGTSGRITIGDINGNDETFFNGTAIGNNITYGNTESRMPRAYIIPEALLKSGENILAIKLQGSSGQQVFGIKNPPLTFAFVPTASLNTQKSVRPTTSVVFQNLNDTMALDAITSADPTANRSELIKKRPSFGRFGELFVNGLPAVSEISPTHISSRNGVRFDVNVDGIKQVSTVLSARGAEIDGWHHKTRVIAKNGTGEISYKSLQHVQYPGTILSLENGNILKLRAKFPQLQGQVLNLSPAELNAVFGQRSNEFNAYIFIPLEKQGTPAFLVTQGLSVNLTQSSTNVDISFAKKTEFKSEPKIYIVYPTGLDRFDFSSRPTQIAEITDIISEEPTTFTLSKWARLAINEPVDQAEWFEVREKQKKVRVYQTARFLSPIISPEFTPYLFLPPQLEYSHERLDYPVDTSLTSPTQILGFSGYFQYIRKPSIFTSKADPTLSYSPVLTGWYDLPLPSISERALPEIAGQTDWNELINKFALSSLGTSGSLNAVDALYKSRAAAYQAFNFLTPENRAILNNNSQQTIRAALGGHFWESSRERFSGLEYFWTRYIQGPFYENYEFDWSNGLALYGLATYVSYSGDYKIVNDNWEAVERLFRWFTVSDDWEWMRASNAQHGHGTGSGEAQNATYSAAIAYSRLAKTAGRQNDYHYGLYTAARAALFSLNRFAYNEFATAHDFKGDNSIILGFHEGKGFLEGELGNYPANATGNISAYGVQPENFDLLMSYASDQIRNYELNFEKAFPNWNDGSYKYPFPTSLADNSGLVTLPHIYLRARMGGDSFASLIELVNQALQNNNYWWTSPTVIAEVLAKRSGGVAITEWDKAKILNASVAHDIERGGDKRRVLSLTVDNNEGSNTLSIRFPRKPSSFQINNGPVPLTDSKFEDGILKLRLRRPGENSVKVQYSIN